MRARTGRLSRWHADARRFSFLAPRERQCEAADCPPYTRRLGPFVPAADTAPAALLPIAARLAALAPVATAQLPIAAALAASCTCSRVEPVERLAAAFVAADEIISCVRPSVCALGPTVRASVSCMFR